MNKIQRVNHPRYLWVYSSANEWTDNWHQRQLKRRRSMGYDIDGFCITPPGELRHWLPFPELDRRWTVGDRKLIDLYEQLARKLEGRDILVLYNGANLHPEFVKWLDVLKVYTAGDDPESTEILTKPIAPAFDIHLVNNIACVEMYRAWGLKNVHFWPLGSLCTIEEISDISENTIRSISNRTIPIVFFGGYQSYRKEKLDQITKTFPNAICAGGGWPRGFVKWDDMWEMYRKSQIGWNFHNSTGPINFRTYELPAYGIMQICDNKSHLGKIFNEGVEVVGFDTLDECIDLTRFYLDHPNEQREIAIAGWKRWKRDYHPDRVWQKLVEVVEPHWQVYRQKKIVDNNTIVVQMLKRTKKNKMVLRIASSVSRIFTVFLHKAFKMIKGAI